MSSTNKYKLAIFDLDGTLVDTIDDLANACNYLINEDNLDYSWSREDYIGFIGDGIKMLVSRAYKHTLTEIDLNEKYKKCKEIYNSIKLENSKIYDGILDVLKELKKRGITICVATNKPNNVAIELLDYLFGKNYFDLVSGAIDNKPVKPNPYLVDVIKDNYNFADDEIIYFGDSDTDVKTAKNCNLFCVAVSWGYRPKEVLKKCNPDMIIDNTRDILTFFN